MPSLIVNDISVEIAEIEDAGESHIAVVWDVKSAHRPVQVHPHDWGLQACTLADLRGCVPKADASVLLNTVGAFGFSTSGHFDAGLRCNVVAFKLSLFDFHAPELDLSPLIR